MRVTLAFLGLLSLLRIAEGYMSGAPSQACGQMEPGHQVASQDAGSSPYSITTSSHTYSCNATVQIKLNGTVPFKGFLCQIRTSADSTNTYGVLTSTGSVPTTTNCGSNVASRTHANSNEKSEVTLIWQPNSNQPQVYVVCTFVQKYDTLWVKQVSSPITYGGGECLPNDSNDDDSNTGNGNQMTSSIILCVVLFGALVTKLSKS